MTKGARIGRGDVLLCPGPVMLSPGVQGALAQCQVGHRDADFSALVTRLRRNVAQVLGAGEEHSVVFITGPATSGIESVCATLFDAGQRVVVPVNGTFGDRIARILEVHGVSCRRVEFGFGKAIDLARLEAAVEGERAEGAVAIAVTHHETSCGLVNPVAEIAALARRHALRTFVDATSSAGAEPLDIARQGIDACVTSSGKCLHGAPGVAIVCARRDWLAERRSAAVRSFSLDLRRYHDQLEANAQTPFTPAVPVFAALDRAVVELLEHGGVAERRRVYQRRRAFLADGLARLGLPLLDLPAAAEACSILTVGVPPSLGFDALYRAMRERGYVIYGTKAPLAPRGDRLIHPRDPRRPRQRMFDPAINRQVFSDWRHFVAFGCGSGLARYAPGTFGTALAILPWILLAQLPAWLYATTVVAAFALGTWVCDTVSRDLGVHDHGGIVFDEFVGYWITMFLAPSGWMPALAGFALFRLFDIWKPWPIRWFDDNVGGGFGIMFDDVVAGVVACVSLHLLLHFTGLAA